MTNVIRGTSGHDRLRGTDASYEYILGLAGNDWIEKWVGAGYVDGGAGTDALSLAGSSAGVAVTLGPSHGTATSAFMSLTLVGFENVRGSIHPDTIIGNDQDNDIVGLTGADLLYGAGGDDGILGGQGADVIFGGKRSDGNDDFGRNALHGGWDNDRIYGGDGRDQITGGHGSDILRGNGGDDEIDGGAGRDVADYSQATGGIAALLQNGRAQGADGNDTLFDIEDLTGSRYSDVLGGDWRANWLSGGAGDDTIFGDGGADTLVGGDGADVLMGGAGADEFHFSFVDTGDYFQDRADRIEDFEVEDVILLPAGLDYAGNHSNPGAGEYTVWARDGGHIVSWRGADQGYHDIFVEGTDPTDSIV